MALRQRILVVDDDPGYRHIVESALQAENYQVSTASDALSALRVAFRTRPDAILLDVTMPQMDGFDVCARLRELTDVPIILVTARDSTEDVVHGFSVGADDYLTKPFSIEELTSRLAVRLRRTGHQNGERERAVLWTESSVLDFGRHELRIGNRAIYLTPMEFEVLRVLMRHPGRVFSAEAIAAQIESTEQIAGLDLVKQYVYRLRKKIEPDPAHPRYLHTMRGAGYYFDPG